MTRDATRAVRAVVAAALLLVGMGSAHADEPLPAPAKHTTCSRAGTACAVSDPATGLTTVSRRDASAPAWTIPGWHRWLFVADDGDAVVVGYDGMNLAPPDVALDEPVFVFHVRGKRVRTVTLGDLYTSTGQLPRTVSHLSWLDSAWIGASNRLMVRLVTGKTLAFSLTTGEAEPARDTPP